MDNFKLIVEVLKQQKINFVALFLSITLSYASYEHFTYNDAKEIFGVLINISAAIFTIVGLWIGVLYPTAMSSIVNDDVSYIKNEQDSPRVEKLVYTIITSATIMIGILTFFLIRTYLHNYDFYKLNIDKFRYLSLVFVVFLSWMQIKCVISLILTNLKFANQLHGRLTKAKMDHK